MPDFLAMRLHAPMQSWGEVATGETRATRPVPTKSGVMGLCASALGIPRIERKLQRQLMDGYGLAVRTDQAGELLEDFHTVGIAEWCNRDKHIRTRADEVRHSAFKTKYITRRGYLTDAVFTVLLWGRVDAPYTLEKIRRALDEPRWPLFLGRRTCPPSPLAARIVNADNLETAFKDVLPLVGMPEMTSDKCPVQFDVDIDAGRINDVRTISVRDAALNRRMWMFAEREIKVGRLP